jgi:crotonobetainyl-CoA:carnitine CoA-transferase CaiB-like acyl-CoA transferase
VHPAAAWLAALETAGIPAAPINDVAQVFEDPQVRHRGLRIDAARLEGGTVPLVASPLRLSGEPPRTPLAPPRLGEHTDEILRERLAMTAAEIADLRKKHVV